MFILKCIMQIMKSCKTWLVLVLVFLLPLQSLAAATNSLCHHFSTNSDHTHAMHEESHNCHKHVNHHSHSDHQKEKNQCVSTCGQLGMAAINSVTNYETEKLASHYQLGLSKTYTSISLPTFQRPPIQQTLSA